MLVVCVSGFFHSALRLWHLSMLLLIVEVHLFSLMDSILLGEYITSFILWLMDIWVIFSLELLWLVLLWSVFCTWTYVCVSIENIYRNEITTSWILSMSDFNRYRQRVFQGVVQISVPPGSVWKLRFLHILAYPWYHCLFLFVFTLAVLVGMQWYCIVSLSFVSQKTNEMEHSCKQD